MSQQVRVERDIVFGGAAHYSPNVKGPLMTELKIFDELFVIASTNDWTETEDNGVTVAASAVDGGAMTLTGSNTAINDCGELSHTAQWSAASNVGVEFKAKVSTTSGVCIAFGLVDLLEGTNNQIAGEMQTAALRDPTNTGDVALMIFDPDDAAAAVWYYAAINDNIIGTPVEAVGSLAPTADEYFRIRIQTNTDGDVTFYYNGVPVGFLNTAIGELSTELLTPYVGFITRVQAASLVTVSRITTWQDCS